MHRPHTLQTRLMTAVIGFVSLILIIVAVITSATLGQALEGRLQDQLRSVSAQTSVLVKQAQYLTVTGRPLTAQTVLAGQHYPGLLLAIATEGGTSGAIVTPDGTTALTADELRTLSEAVQHAPNTAVTLDKLGSFQVTVQESDGVEDVVKRLLKDK